MSIIVSNCQHCDEQQFQIVLSCVHYAIFSVMKLDLFIRALLLDRILALEEATRTPRVLLVTTDLYFWFWLLLVLWCATHLQKKNTGDIVIQHRKLLCDSMFVLTLHYSTFIILFSLSLV